MLATLKKLCLRSWTIAWAHLKMLAGLAIVSAPAIGDALNDPNIAPHLPPHWVGYGLMGVAAVTYAARIIPHASDGTLG